MNEKSNLISVLSTPNALFPHLLPYTRNLLDARLRVGCARIVASKCKKEKSIADLPPSNALISPFFHYTRSLLDARLRVCCVRKKL